MNKILIVEDDLVFARALKNWLEKENFQVEYATNAARARRMLSDNEDADLILSDMRLPDGDGVEILEWLNKRDSRIPFVVMTQYAEVQSAVKAMKLGAVDYLPKPFMPETLYTVINGLLHRKKKVPPETFIFKRMNAKIQQVEKHTKLVAATDMSVLVRGENGTIVPICLSLLSIAEPFRRIWLHRSSSVISREPSPVLWTIRTECFMRLMEAHCSLMKWEISHTKYKHFCYEPCRKGAIVR